MSIYIILLVIIMLTLLMFFFALFSNIFNITFLYFSLNLSPFTIILIILLCIFSLYKTYRYLWLREKNKFKIIGLPIIISLVLLIIINCISYSFMKRYQNDQINNYRGYINNEVLNKYEDDDYAITFNYENQKELCFLIKGKNSYINLIFEKNTYNIISENYIYN